MACPCLPADDARQRCPRCWCLLPCCKQKDVEILAQLQPGGPRSLRGRTVWLCLIVLPEGPRGCSLKSFPIPIHVESEAHGWEGNGCEAAPLCPVRVQVCTVPSLGRGLSYPVPSSLPVFLPFLPPSPSCSFEIHGAYVGLARSLRCFPVSFPLG